MGEKNDDDMNQKIKVFLSLGDSSKNNQPATRVGRSFSSTRALIPWHFFTWHGAFAAL